MPQGAGEGKEEREDDPAVDRKDQKGVLQNFGDGTLQAEETGGDYTGERYRHFYADLMIAFLRN